MKKTKHLLMLFASAFALNTNAQEASPIPKSFESASIAIYDSTNANDTKLNNYAKSLEEAIVVGYGTQKRRNLVSATSSLDKKNLETRSFLNLGQALQGTVSGVTTISEGGGPNSGINLMIRGLGGLGGQSTLVVVDGVVDAPLPNPNDIASIDIVKDANAAIYGARASGGVVLVTTKKGVKGAAIINVSSKFGYNEITKLPSVLDAHGLNQAQLQAYQNDGSASTVASFNPALFPYGDSTRTDWFKELFRKAYIQEYNIDMSAASDTYNYFMSVGYRRNEGTLINSYNEKYYARLNADYKFKEWLKGGVNSSFAFNQGQEPNSAGNGSSNRFDVITAAYQYPRHIPVYDSADRFAGTDAGKNGSAGDYSDLRNPVATAKRLTQINPSTSFFANPYLEFTILKNFKFRTSYGITRANSYFKSFSPKIPEAGNPVTLNFLNESYAISNTYLTEQTLTYKLNTSAGHNIDVLLGYTFQKNTTDFLSIQTNSYGGLVPNIERDPTLQYLSNIDSVKNNTITGLSDGKTATALESWLGRFNYNFKETYFLTAILRRDGSSIIENNRYEMFPALSASWNITNESIIPKNDILNFAKLRASWGRQGNISSLPANATNYSLTRRTIALNQAGSTTGSSIYSLYLLNAIPNPDIRWEIAEQANIGADFALLQNALTFSIDVFNKSTTRMIYQMPPPPTSGLSYGQYVNLGKATDNGVEITAAYHSDRNKELVADFSVNTSWIKNNIEDLGSQLSTITNLGNTAGRGVLTPMVQKVGMPVYAFYGYKTQGLFQSQSEVDAYVGGADNKKIQDKAKAGDIKFLDANGDGKLSDSDKVYLGSPVPTLSFGGTVSLAYKGFSLYVLFQGVTGNKIFNGVKYYGLNAAGGQNLSTDVQNAWTTSNTNTSTPRLSKLDANGNFSNSSDFYIEDGSYFRIKNITIAYTIPTNIINKTGLNNCKLYASFDNLYTITKYSGLDQEIGLANGGIDNGRYPIARTVLFGISIGL